MYLLNFFDTSQPRKSSVLRQVFTNKKTGSVIYWAFRYNYLQYLNLAPQLDNEILNKKLNELVNKELLVLGNDGYQLTLKGKKQLMLFNKKHYFFETPTLFVHYNYSLWDALMRIAIQVSSEYSYGNFHYFVASDNLQAQFIIKKWLAKYSFQILKKELTDALLTFLSNYSQLKADIFTLKLVGHNINGATNEQLALQFDLNALDIEIIWKDLTLHFAEFLRKQNNELSELVKMTYESTPLSSSILNTKQLFDHGYSITQICHLRHLKRSTIEEHLQLLAIFNNNFPYIRLLSNSDMKILQKIYRQLPIDHWNFKNIQMQYPQFPFLKYRLYAIKKTHEEYDRKR